MIAPQHTPGPWKAFTHWRTATFAVLRADGKPVIQWTGFDAGEGTRREKRANALLTAAAPERLAALSRIVAWDEAGLVLTEDHIHQANVAIAKALGRKVRNTRAPEMSPPSQGADDKACPPPGKSGC